MSHWHCKKLSLKKGHRHAKEISLLSLTFCKPQIPVDEQHSTIQATDCWSLLHSYRVQFSLLFASALKLWFCSGLENKDQKATIIVLDFNKACLRNVLLKYLQHINSPSWDNQTLKLDYSPLNNCLTLASDPSSNGNVYLNLKFWALQKHIVCAVFFFFLTRFFCFYWLHYHV